MRLKMSKIKGVEGVDTCQKKDVPTPLACSEGMIT